MNKAYDITEEKAFEQDVKTMSYEELMATIRYLNEERKIIAKKVDKDLTDSHKDNKENKNNNK